MKEIVESSSSSSSSDSEQPKSTKLPKPAKPIEPEAKPVEPKPNRVPKPPKEESSSSSDSSSEDERDTQTSKTTDKNLALTPKLVDPIANPAKKSAKKRKRKRQPKNKNKLPQIEVEKMAAKIAEPSPKVEIAARKKRPLPSQASQWHATQNGNQVPNKSRPDPRHKFFEEEEEEADFSQLANEIDNNDEAVNKEVAKSQLLPTSDDVMKKIAALSKTLNGVPKYCANSEDITCEQVTKT